jgi:XTP/dITP diphosphohydrolase
MEKIIIATANPHKSKEFCEIFAPKQVLCLADIGFEGEIEENGTTFLENALIKAKTVSEFLKNKGIVASVLADDSGLCVQALDGAPGVYSARYAGGAHDFKANRQKLLEQLKDKTNRDAYFECALVEYFPDGSYILGSGKTHGKITTQEIGDNSFGYDCLFWSYDLNKTFGQASSQEKNSVSHRGRAIADLMSKKK